MPHLQPAGEQMDVGLDQARPHVCGPAEQLEIVPRAVGHDEWFLGDGGHLDRL